MIGAVEGAVAIARWRIGVVSHGSGGGFNGEDRSYPAMADGRQLCSQEKKRAEERQQQKSEALCCHGSMFEQRCAGL